MTFLLQALKLVGLPQKFVDLIRACVCTSWIGVSISREVDNFFLPERGLRQGCPMAPYLFIICMEVLSSLLHEAESKRIFKGLRINYAAPAVLHLMFADYLIISGKQLSWILRPPNISSISSPIDQAKWLTTQSLPFFFTNNILRTVWRQN